MKNGLDAINLVIFFYSFIYLFMLQNTPINIQNISLVKIELPLIFNFNCNFEQINKITIYFI